MEPEEWYTPDELGVVLIKSSYFDRYQLFIATEHEEKALLWMRDGKSAPYAIKYGDEFYEIMSLCVFPGLSGNANQFLVRMGIILVVSWITIALIFVRSQVHRKVHIVR